jgi:hypothetical protein
LQRFWLFPHAVPARRVLRCELNAGTGQGWTFDLTFCTPKLGCSRHTVGTDRLHYPPPVFAVGTLRLAGSPVPPVTGIIANLLLPTRDPTLIKFSGVNFVNWTQAIAVYYGIAMIALCLTGCICVIA